MRWCAVAIATIGISLTSISIALAETPVYFADTHLKAAVEAALHKTNPTPTEWMIQ
jgi:hypothetical protein